MEPTGNHLLTEERSTLREQILSVTSETFEEVALRVFSYQARHNAVYRAYLSCLGIKHDHPKRLAEVPHLPIQFFKHHTVRTGQPPPLAVNFESSSTTGSMPGVHSLYDAPLYHTLSQRIFEQQYGPLNDFHLLALLPSYLERSNSSLVYMIRHFIKQTDSPVSGFYLHDTHQLTTQLQKLAESNGQRRVLVLGVTFGLLDWVESTPSLRFIGQMPSLTVMETGGMKGRRREMLREEVHEILTDRLGVPAIHSEYGMTELLSQSYSQGEGVFQPGATMRVMLRDPYDPFAVMSYCQASSDTGGINVTDLGNLDSCAFVETQDLGRFGPQKDSFYVIGRFDNTDLRGCNLMVL